MSSPTSFSLSGQVFASDGRPYEATLYLAGGLIDRVVTGRDPGADLQTDGFIAPGLIDLQVNGAYGVDFTGDASSIAQVAERLPETGVTAFMPTIITSAFDAYPARLREALACMQAEASMRESRGAHVLGVHLEGPYMNPKRKGAHPQSCIRPINVDEIRAWADPAVVRIVTLAPELEGAAQAIRALREAGIVVSEGHSDATFAQAMAGFQAGANWGTHLFNAMSPLQHREPGLIGALLVSNVPCGIIVDGIHMHPAMVHLAYQSKGKDGLCLVTDSMAAMGMAPGRYLLGEYDVIVDGTSARLEDGTLAGSILTLDQAVRNMAAFTGCTLAHAIHMATATPARLLGLARKGSLTPGSDADLVVLSPDAKVTHTLVMGSMVYQK